MRLRNKKDVFCLLEEMRGTLASRKLKTLFSNVMNFHQNCWKILFFCRKFCDVP